MTVQQKGQDARFITGTAVSFGDIMPKAAMKLRDYPIRREGIVEVLRWQSESTLTTRPSATI